MAELNSTYKENKQLRDKIQILDNKVVKLERFNNHQNIEDKHKSLKNPATRPQETVNKAFQDSGLSKRPKQARSL